MTRLPLLISRSDSFAKNHNISRWDLSNKEDSYKLWYSLECISMAYMDLFFAEQRHKHYKKATSAFAMHFILQKVQTILFPYSDGSGCDVSDILNRVERRIEELEAGASP